MDGSEPQLVLHLTNVKSTSASPKRKLPWKQRVKGKWTKKKEKFRKNREQPNHDIKQNIVSATSVETNRKSATNKDKTVKSSHSDDVKCASKSELPKSSNKHNFHLLGFNISVANNNKQNDHSSPNISPKFTPSNSSPSKKRKRNHEETNSGDASMVKKMKTSLFTSNPAIPNVASVPVEPVKEAIFTANSFGDLALHPFMVSNLSEQMGMTTMTRVQQQTIPLIIQKKDVLVKSQTGSGKTLSYAIPIIQMLQEGRPKIQRSDGTHAIVIVPTRELALQSFEAFRKLCNPFTWIVPGVIMGGERRKAEKSRIRKGLNIVISTPGRLVDHLSHTQNLSLTRVQWLVIDEADRLMDLGFEKEVSQVISCLQEKGPKDRQTILLSATLSAGVERLAGMTLIQPVKVDLTNQKQPQPKPETSSQRKAVSVDPNPVSTSTPADVTFAIPENLLHHFVVVPSKLRLVTLAAFVLWKCKYSKKRSKMVIFMATQDSAAFHYTLFQNCLNADNVESGDDSGDLDLFLLHGEMEQKERTKVYQDFCRAESGVLFCTDVAARGLDLPQVRWIVQFNSPGSATDYIHRVGRTARIGAKGSALLFLMPAEVEYVKLLAKYKINLEEVAMDDILRTLYIQAHNKTSKRSMPHTLQESATALQGRFLHHIEGNKDTRNLARKGYQSYVRSYSSYPLDVKHIFHVKTLHLGHAATSFGLQEAPTKIGGLVGKHAKLASKHNRSDKKKHSSTKLHKVPSSQKAVQGMLSEFSSGLEDSKGHINVNKHLNNKAKRKNKQKLKPKRNY